MAIQRLMDTYVQFYVCRMENFASGIVINAIMKRVEYMVLH